MSNPELDLKALPPERMLAELVQRLQDKADELQDYSDYDYCYCAETCTCRGSTTDGMHRAGDDLNWILMAFGLERK